MKFIEPFIVRNPKWRSAQRLRTHRSLTYPYFIGMHVKEKWWHFSRTWFWLRGQCVYGDDPHKTITWFIDSRQDIEGETLPEYSGQRAQGTFLLPGGQMLSNEQITAVYWLERERQQDDLHRNRSNDMHNELYS